jgi:hypothetical protein
VSRHLQAVDDSSRGPWFLSTRAEIDAWAAERWATLSALMEADASEEPAQLELGMEAA